MESPFEAPNDDEAAVVGRDHFVAAGLEEADRAVIVQVEDERGISTGLDGVVMAFVGVGSWGSGMVPKVTPAPYWFTG